MRDATWQQRVDALGRGHYRRYDERTSTMLGDGAALVLDRWGGDLRRLGEQAGYEPDKLRSLLTEVPGIGKVGADIFLREVQAVWPKLRPFVDQRVAEGARRLGLPTSPDALVRLAGGDDLSRLTAALVRVSLDKKLAKEISKG
jgi:hypothetical protein